MTTRARTLRSWAPLLGFVSSLLVAVGGCARAFSHRDTWLWAPADAVGARVDEIGRPLTALGVAGLVLAWWLLKPRADGPFASWRTAALWCLPLLLVPPVLTADPFFYADVGWLVHQGADIDTTPVGSVSGPYAAAVDPTWVGIVAVYPPLAVMAAHGAVVVAGFDPYWGVIAQRGVALLGVGLAAWALPRVASDLGVDRSWLVWATALNPLLVLHLVGGAHNDAPMIGVAVCALLLARRHGQLWWVTWVVAPALVGLAVTFKPQAIVVIAPVVLWPVAAEPRGRHAASIGRAVLRLLGGASVAVGVVLVISAATGRSFAWVGQIQRNGEAPSFGPALVLAEALQRGSDLLGSPVPWAVTAGAGLAAIGAVGVCGWLFVSRPGRPLELAAWAGLLLSAASTFVMPWHLSLGVVLLALLPVTRAVTWGYLVLAGYLVASATLFATGLEGVALLAVVPAVAGVLWLVDRWVGPERSPAVAEGSLRA